MRSAWLIIGLFGALGCGEIDRHLGPGLPLGGSQSGNGGATSGGAIARGGNDGTGGRLTTGGSTGLNTGGKASGGGETGVITGGRQPMAGNTGIITGGRQSTTGGASSLGGRPATGGTAAGGTSNPGSCFSPSQDPELALSNPEIPGCECNQGSACVTVTTPEGRLWDVALICEDGRWQSVEDGPCSPQAGPRQAACKVRGRVYSSGSTDVPDAHSCNTCTCEDGELVSCTEQDCEMPCPPNGGPGRQCAECGPTDACLIVEHTCLQVCSISEHCNGGVCLENMCRSSVCG